MHYQISASDSGTTTLAGLVDKVAAGEVGAATKVWTKGMKSWRPLQAAAGAAELEPHVSASVVHALRTAAANATAAAESRSMSRGLQSPGPPPTSPSPAPNGNGVVARSKSASMEGMETHVTSLHVQLEPGTKKSSKLSCTEAQAAISSGKITPLTKVWAPGMKKWRLLQDLNLVFPARTASAAATPQQAPKLRLQSPGPLHISMSEPHNIMSSIGESTACREDDDDPSWAATEQPQAAPPDSESEEDSAEEVDTVMDTSIPSAECNFEAMKASATQQAGPREEKSRPNTPPGSPKGDSVHHSAVLFDTVVPVGPTAAKHAANNVTDDADAILFQRIASIASTATDSMQVLSSRQFRSDMVRVYAFTGCIQILFLVLLMGSGQHTRSFSRLATLISEPHQKIGHSLY